LFGIDSRPLYFIPVADLFNPNIANCIANDGIGSTAMARQRPLGGRIARSRKTGQKVRTILQIVLTRFPSLTHFPSPTNNGF
jgi:hypothetical protein